MKTLDPDSFYDPLEWELFLEAHRFSIEDVYKIDFLEDGRITVHSYRTDQDGKHYALPIEGGMEVATEEPVTITPESTIPVWS